MNIAELIDKHYEDHPDNPRPHLGCSMLGHPCDRYLWLSFRWAVSERLPGRMTRLFQRGHREEESALKNLALIGITVHSKQKHVDFGAHVSGSIDGLLDKVPSAPFERHLFECKTYNKKSFNELEKKGVREARPVHYIQMQVYMHGTKTKKAVYYAVCKDDDRLHIEIIDYDQHEALAAIERGHAIALSKRMPEPISANPEWYQCKMCAMHEFCHQTQTTKNVNCRTCRNATPQENSTWQCGLHPHEPIPYHHQLEGCDSHVLHFDLVPYTCSWDADTGVATFTTSRGTVRNGHPAPDVYTSKEILADPTLCSANDDFVAALRTGLSARIVAPQ